MPKMIPGQEILWLTLPLRRCYTMHACKLCAETIRDGQRYFDGGYGRRAHEGCARAFVRPVTPQPREHRGHFPIPPSADFADIARTGEPRG